MYKKFRQNKEKRNKNKGRAEELQKITKQIENHDNTLTKSNKQ